MRFDERDFMLYRWHGWNPVYDGGVEALLRQMGTRTVIMTGVSLNVSLPASSITLASGGFNVVIPTDCVAAADKEYGDMVLRHTMRVTGTVTTSDDIIEAWHRSE
jgi:nicotinamidase-related amidase